MSPLARWVTMLAVLALMTAACGDDVPPTSFTARATTDATSDGEAGRGAASAQTLRVAARNIAFSTSTLNASRGAATITFENNDDGIPHNFRVTGQGLDEKTEIEPGPITQRLTVELRSGSYTFVCDVHPQQMTGEIVVN